MADLKPRVPTPTMTEAQRAYETKRAAKAGMSLEKWLDAKRRQAEADSRAAARAETKTRAEMKKPGLLRRLIARGHAPLGQAPEKPAGKKSGR